MQSYEQQVQVLCQQLQDICGTDLKPQALIPHAWPAGSGSAVCQLQEPTADGIQDTASNTQTKRTSARHAAENSNKASRHLGTNSRRSRSPPAASTAGEHESQLQTHSSGNQQAALPEVQQLLSSNQQLLVTFLVDTWTQHQRLQQQQQQMTQLQSSNCHPQPDDGALQQQGNATTAAPTAAAPTAAAVANQASSVSSSSWMHAGLQQYLNELERGSWVTPPAAAAAEVAAAGPALHFINSSPQQAAAESSSSSSCDLLSWLRALHPTAAVAGDGVTQNPATQQQQQRQFTSAAHSSFGRGRSKAAAAAAAGVNVDALTVGALLSQGSPGCSIHPNIQPVLLLATAASSSSTGSSSSDVCCIVTHYHTTDLASLLRFSPGSLGGDWYIRFLLYQLLQGLATLHDQGLPLGGFSLDQIYQVLPGWIQLLAKPSGTLVTQPERQQQQQQQQQQQRMYVVREPSYTLPQLTEMWRLGTISNLEYLLWLNAAAGRRWGDRRRHPYVPWVIDFSVKPDLNAPPHSSSSSSVPPGWRDLGISQYRRIKGDAQLDQTYAMSAAAAAAGITSSNSSGTTNAFAPDHHQITNAPTREPWTWPIWGSSSSSTTTGSSNARDLSSTTVPPHHISNEPMSELSYAIYMARRLPVELLVKLVRRSFQPEEFPCSVEILYHSSPDEALPQFYTDPKVFHSLHSSMSDLAIPDWATSAQEFVNMHRAALESDYVSANLHKWIDLNFGVALSGPAGLAAKNIHLRTQQQHGSSSSSGGGGYGANPAAGGSSSDGGSSSSGGWLPVTHGVYQLFDQPHPPRCSSRMHAASNGNAIPSVTAARRSQHLQAAAAAAVEDHDDVTLLDSCDYSPPPSPGQLAACWRDIASLEAAAATGSWQSGVKTAAAAGSRIQTAQVQQQQQHKVDGAGSMELLPAAAADVAAVGQVAMHLYKQQQQQQQLPLGLSRSTGSGTVNTGGRKQAGSSSSSSVIACGSGTGGSVISDSDHDHEVTTGDHRSLRSNFGPAVSNGPAAAALFIQQCSSGEFTVQALLHSPFFPVWMESAWKFMVKMLYAQKLYSVHLQQTAQKSSTKTIVDDRSAMKGHRQKQLGSSSSSNACDGAFDCTVCWCIQDAFESLATAAAGPTGALYQLAQAPEAIQLCLPAIMHVTKCRLLQPQANARQMHALVQQQQQVRAAVDHVNSVCVVLLQLASVLSPLLLQQHLLPLLQAMLVTEQQDANAPSAAVAAVHDNAKCTQQQQQLKCTEAVRVSACRRAVLQPLLWQILLAKLPQQQLLQELLPLLLLAVLEPQHDWMCPCCTAADMAAHGANNTAAAAAAVNGGQCNAAAAAADMTRMHEAAGTQATPQQQQQQQQVCTLVQLASSCLAVLAEALPFPVVCQHMLRPLLVALPWAGSTAHTARGSSASCNAVQNAVHNASVPLNGAAVTLQAIAGVLPARLAARCVFNKAMQLALLPLLHSSSSSSSGMQGTDTMQAVRVGRYTAAALPVLENLLEHVLPVLNRDLVLPAIGDFLIPAHVPPAAAAAGSSALPLAAAAAGEESQTVSALANNSKSRALTHSKSAGSSSSSMTSAAANAAAAASTQVTPATADSSSTIKQQQQQQHVTDLKLYQLFELLLQPPDVKAVSSSPMLYPRIVALCLCALDKAAENAAAAAGSSAGVTTLTAATASSSSSSSSLTGIVTHWLLPQVLLPLLSPPVAAAWQVPEQVQRSYWRSVLLLYAAAVRVLGLKEVRELVPAWHSVEVWLSAETGWEIQQQSPLAADNSSSSSTRKNTDALPHPAHLISLFAQRDMLEAEKAATAAAAAASERASEEDDAAAGSSNTMRNGMMSRIVLRQSSTDGSSAAAAAAAGGDGSLCVDTPTGSSFLNGVSTTTAASSSSSNLSGRVSSLLRRITEDKVVRRNLSTTQDFMQGVGWSKPRPASATNAFADGGNATAAAAAEAPTRSTRRALSAPLAAAAAAAAARYVDSHSELDTGGSNSSTSDAATVTHWALDPIPNDHNAFSGSNSFSAAKHVPAAAAAAADNAPLPAAAAAGVSSGTRSWAAELSELRLLLESPARSSSERGPSAGKEWFWLLQPQNEPSHLLPAIHTTAASSSSSIVSGSSRPWRSVYGCWWEEGWNLGAQVLHGWPAHKDRLRALAVDPGERWVVTAGRSSVRDASGSVMMTSSSSSVVRVWELSDAETKVQYSGHTAAVHQVAFLGCGCSAVASLDVTGAIHVWSRSTGAQLNCFIPEECQPTTSLIGVKPAADVSSSGSSTTAAAAAAASEQAAGTAAVDGTDAGGRSSRASNTTDAAAAAPEAAAHILQQQQGGGFQERGCSSSRGWQGQPTLYTTRQLAATAAAAAARSADAAAAAGSSVVAGGPSAVLALGGCLGYTCMLNPTSNNCPYAYSDPISLFGGSSSSSLGGSSSSSDSWQSSFGVLLAGTADGRVCCLDVETGALLDDIVAHWEPRSVANPYYIQQQQQQQLLMQQQQSPALYSITNWEDPSSSVISAVSCSNAGHPSSSGGSSGVRGFGSWIAAGSGSGRIMLLDSRSGFVLSSWQGHSQRVSQLQGLVGFKSDWQLLSCSQDKTLKLWDLRLLRQSRCWPGSSSSSGCMPLATYKGSKDGIEGFAVYQDAAIVYGGPNLGLAPLSVAASSSSVQQQPPGWSAAAVHQVRMTGLRGGSARGLGGMSKGTRDGGLGSKGLSSSAAIVGLGLLPSSKLLVVGQEDGQLRIVR